MLVTSAQSSTQRPLGLSVEELYALDRQYRRIEQQQQHFTQLQSQSRLASSNLNRLTSRSLDLVSSPISTPLTVLPSLEIHGHGYNNRPHTPSTTTGLHHHRSNSIDHLQYTPPVLTSATKPITYSQRPSTNDTLHQQYPPRYRNYIQPSSMATGPTSMMTNHYMHPVHPSSNEHYDARASCKLRRQQPVKRESSRRIVVRPVVQRRREPSISSSCESLDEPRSSLQPIPNEQSNFPLPSAPFPTTINSGNKVIENLDEVVQPPVRLPSTNDSLSDDSDVNLYEMRVPIGKTYDTSDISVQLEGPKILIHCHTIEPTDKRGNYRKHEFKTELLVPDVVDDETIVAYLTEDGQLIVEGKYHTWAWREMKHKRKLEQQETIKSPPPVLPPPINIPSTVNPTLTAQVSTRTDGGLEREQRIMSPLSNPPSRFSHYPPSLNRIEKLENNRTVIHVGEITAKTSQQTKDPKSVSDMINRFNTLNTNSSTSISDGQYSLSNDTPPLLFYHIRLPLEASMDSIRIQPDPQSNILKVFSDPRERSTLNPEQYSNRSAIRSIPRICRLPRDFTYDYTHLRVIFLRDNFIRIEVPTLS